MKAQRKADGEETGDALFSLRPGWAATLLLGAIFWSLEVHGDEISETLVPEVDIPPGLHARPRIDLPVASLPPRVHAFWDRQNIFLFAGVGVMRILDYTSTQNMLRRGREEILLPQDVVENHAGFAALEVAATATSIGISYLFHRTRHHKLERWLSIGHISVAGFGAARNYALESKHP